MSELAWDALATPLGEMWVACSPHGVARVSFGTPPRHLATLSGVVGQSGDGTAACRDRAHALAGVARAEIDEYFRGERRFFDVPVDWSAASGTRRGVLAVLQASVGYGETITYGALAARAGLAGSGRTAPARVVGQAMGANPWPVIVPCHRVVASHGLGGYSGGAGVETKRALLILEGAIPATLDFG